MSIRRLSVALSVLFLAPAAAFGADPGIAELEASLAARRPVIEADQKALNVDCSSVPSTDAKKVAECSRRQKDVQRRIDEYKADRKRLASLKATSGGEAARAEQEKYVSRREEWAREMKRIVEERLKDPSRIAGALTDALGLGKSSIPPEAATGFSDLKAGDVVLVTPEAGSPGSHGGRWLDVLTSATGSPVSHTVLFLKDVKGTKLFLDHTINEGGTVITEKDLIEKYGERGMYQARLAEPLKDNQAADLYKAAIEFQKKESATRDDRQNRNVVRKFFDSTGYGPYGDDMVCSEADRWVLVKAGRELPESKSWAKKILGVEYGPVNIYSDRQNFIVTHLTIPSAEGKK